MVQVESKVVPKHKKNADVGNKTTYYADTIYVEQADAASFAQDEEVSLALRIPPLFLHAPTGHYSLLVCSSLPPGY
jgi:hypothetical protein